MYITLYGHIGSSNRVFKILTVENGEFLLIVIIYLVCFGYNNNNIALRLWINDS